ncbi:hypothetical protein [Corynebacterium provencense]|uniref:hypothetical protein n=1 Tax=Corynebacterium provencense TaxID=1737425 RepID=UPI00082A8EDA|nr:hypothetical protein [Corynebacterium provencense]
MRTRIPLPDFDAEDLPSAARLSIARGRARQERKNQVQRDRREQQLDVLRGAWTAGRSLGDPAAWRRYVEAKAAGLTAS